MQEEYGRGIAVTLLHYLLPDDTVKIASMNCTICKRAPRSHAILISRAIQRSEENIIPSSSDDEG
jgi:hypothetical protein